MTATCLVPIWITVTWQFFYWQISPINCFMYIKDASNTNDNVCTAYTYTHGESTAVLFANKSYSVWRINLYETRDVLVRSSSVMLGIKQSEIVTTNQSEYTNCHQIQISVTRKCQNKSCCTSGFTRCSYIVYHCFGIPLDEYPIISFFNSPIAAPGLRP